MPFGIASEFYKDGRYDLSWKAEDSTRVVDAKEFCDFYADQESKHPIVTIGDPFDQDDFDAY